MAITLFSEVDKTGELRYGRDSKFQRLWYWLPDNPIASGKRKVAVFSRGGTLMNPGNGGALSLTTSNANGIAQMLSNELDMIIVSMDYRPGGFTVPQGQDVDKLHFPEILEDFALCIQYLKGKANDETLWGAGNTLSLDPNDWFRYGTSSGGWGAGYTQLMPDGAWPYAPSGAVTTDLYLPRHNHLCNAIYLNIPQTVFSTFNEGAMGHTTGYYSSYQEYSWGGAYFFDSREVQNDPDPLWGWNKFPMDTKVSADFDEHLYNYNPRVTDAAFYLKASDLSDNIIQNQSGNVPNGFDVLYWRGAHYPSGQVAAASTGHYDLHDPWQCYWLYHRLQQLGNDKSRLRAGNSTSNPDATTRQSEYTTGDLREWLTGDLGWIHPRI